MISKDYRPLAQFISVYCDYSEVPWKIRQKMSFIQSYMIDLFHSSRIEYKLCIFSDGLCLLNPLTNRILWSLPSNSSVVVLLELLKEINRYYYYAKDYTNIKTIIQRNDFLTLRNKYERKN